MGGWRVLLSLSFFSLQGARSCFRVLLTNLEVRDLRGSRPSSKFDAVLPRIHLSRGRVLSSHERGQQLIVVQEIVMPDTPIILRITKMVMSRAVSLQAFS